ncbi:hypothetical protein [Streptomyces scopuliridis]|uniref:hypothetical protein n=1 Tax=Streptomyces scopuliridis TaxID=452529 RepID=UPI003442B514
MASTRGVVRPWAPDGAAAVMASASAGRPVLRAAMDQNARMRLPKAVSGAAWAERRAVWNMLSA